MTPEKSDAGDGAASYMKRMLELLEACVHESGGVATIAALSSTTGIPQSTTARLVGRLTEWGFLADGGSKGFFAGSRLIAMSFAVLQSEPNTRRLEQATAELSTLAGESVTAGSIMGDVMFITARTESTEAVRVVDRVGEPISPDRSALGKAIMSWMPRDRRIAMLRAADVEDPDTALSELELELDIARRRGYAVDEETFAPGLRCRAAAFLGPDGIPIGGLSIGGPTARFTPQRADEVVPGLLRVAERLSITPPKS